MSRRRVAHVLLLDSPVRKDSSQLLRDLARRQGHSLVSCYVPFARAGKEVRQNAIRLKNCQRLLAAAAAAGTVDERAAATVSRELGRAAETAENPRATRGAGVALFAADGECVTVDAGVPFPSLVTIAPRFYVVPLVPQIATAPPVLVLAVSPHAVRLIDRSTTQELPLPEAVPRSLADVAGAEREQPTLQQHSVGTGAVFHGHGEGDDDVLPELENYCRHIARALHGEIERARAAVILAADVQIASLFRRTAAGWPLFAEHIHGNHDRTGAAQLAAFATPLVAAQQEAQLAQLRESYGALAADRRASDDPADIAAAAREGRIDTLLLEHSAALDEPRVRAAREPHAIQPEGPFNTEAVCTLRCGGHVRIVGATDMPTHAPQAAIFRF